MKDEMMLIVKSFGMAAGLVLFMLSMVAVAVLLVKFLFYATWACISLMFFCCLWRIFYVVIKELG